MHIELFKILKKQKIVVNHCVLNNNGKCYYITTNANNFTIHDYICDTNIIDSYVFYIFGYAQNEPLTFYVYNSIDIENTKIDTNCVSGYDYNTLSLKYRNDIIHELCQ